MTMRKTALALLVGGFALAGAMTDPAAAQTNLRVGLSEDPDALDPHLNRSAVGVSVMISLCDSLLTQDSQLNFRPMLATEWAWADSNRTLNLTLRRNVTFHDGTPFNAEAVKANIERAMTLPESQRRDDAAAIDRVEVTGEYTVAIRLKSAFAPLLAKLAERLGMMMSPRALREAGANFARNPVCSGPFRFVERVAQDRIVIERYPGYWDAGNFHIDRVTYRVIPDGTVRLANLQAGGLDIIERVEPTDAAQVTGNQRLRLQPVDTIGYLSLVINMANTARGNHPMGRDPRVREAFDLALDRAAIVQVAFEGRYPAGNQPVVPGSPYYNPQIPIQPRNLERARAILREAGYTQPIPFEITVPNQPSAVRVAEIIQAMTNEAGFNTQLKVVEFATSLNLTDAGDFQAWGPIGPLFANDPDAVTYMSLHSTGSRNVGKYSSPEMDRLMEATRTESDPDRRRALFHQVAQLIARDRAVIYLYHPRFLFAMSSRVTGFEPLSDALFLLRGVRLAAQ